MAKQFDTKFNLNHQYKLLLKRMGFKERQLNPTQRRVMKEMVFAGWAQLLILMRDDLGGIEDENEAVETMQHLHNQTFDFVMKMKNKSN